MPKTKTEIKNWLKTPEHIRRILVDIDGVVDATTGLAVGTARISNGAYVNPTDNLNYNPIIIGGVSFSESFSVDGSLSRSYGDIEIDNTNGILDSTYFNYIFVNKNITIYLGDPSWPKSDFKVIFRGIIKDVASRSRNTINIIISDKLEVLNGSLSDLSITNTDKNNTKELIPVCFGECFNVTPLLTNKSTLEYQVHTGPIEDIIEVRDNGLPVSITKDLNNGKFRLNQNVYGQITCSVQGHKPSGTYTNKIGETITNILTGFGPSNARLTLSDLDTTNFNNFDSNFIASSIYKRPIGYYANSTQNLLDVCNQITNSVRARLSINCGIFDDDSVVGKVCLKTLKKDNNINLYNINSTDIEEFSISLTDKYPLKGITKIAYCKNWTVQQSGLAGGLPPANIALFDSEWLYATTANNTTITNYLLANDSEQEDTLLINNTGAAEESNLRNQLWSVPRYNYTMTAYPHMFDVQLGDNITITNRRYNLNNANGTIISVARDWITGRVEIGVLV